MFKAKWVVLWSLWAARVLRQPTAPLRVSNGWVTGFIAPSGSYAGYLGIPYATIMQRFQAPGPEPVWDGVFDAVNEHIRCTQDLQVGSERVIGQENCLILNVYKPLNTATGDSVPVMVFIHGGGFFEGSSSPGFYGPEYLVNNGIILVTINYRLNIQGFLCLGIKEAPGNAGLKDQVAALKWVQRNIRKFGGDPDNVTIFGESAGSASVSYHVLSEMSKGLFHRAIMQSGSSLASWAFQHEPVEVAVRKASLWSFESKDPYDLYHFFNSHTQSDLVSRVVPKDVGNIVLSQLIFLPCVEKKIDGVEPFLTDMPHNILSKGQFNKVPVMIGATTQEGILFVNMETTDYLPKVDIEKTMPKNLHFPSSEERRDTANELKRLYRLEHEISNDNVDKLSKYVGEAFFNHPSVAETDLIMKHSDQPVYSYLFAYDGRRNVKNLARKELKTIPGATHADDLLYLFSQHNVPSLFESRMIQKITTLWTNFAKYGNPTPAASELLPLKWPEASEDGKGFVIDEDCYTVPLVNEETIAFWNKIYSKYRRKYTTYSA